MKKYIYLLIFFLLINEKLLSFNYTEVNNEAINYCNQGLYDISDNLFMKILKKSKIDKKYDITLDAYVSLGYNQIRQNKFINAIKFYSEAIKFKEKKSINEYKNLSYLYKQYAYANSFLGNHITAIEYYQKAQKVVLKKENFKTYYNCKIDEVTSLMYLGYFEKALDQLHNIESEVVSFNNLENQIVLYLNIIDCNIKLNKIEKVNNYIKVVQPLISITNDIDYKFNFEFLKANKYLLHNDTVKCLDSFKKLQINQWGDYNQNVAKIEEIKILENYNINLINEQKLLELEKFFTSIDDKETLITIYKILVKLDNQNKYLDKYLTINNAHLIKTRSYLNQALVLHENLNKDLIKITLRNNELEYQKYILIICLISLIIMLVLTCIIFRYIKTKRKILEVKNEFEDSNFILKTNLKNLIQDIQIYFFTNESISKDFILNLCNQLINYQKSIKE